MKTNMGPFDGYLRSLLFILSLIFSVMTGQWWWAIPGAILFATAILTWCPAYALLDTISHKVNTSHKNRPVFTDPLHNS